MLFFFCNVIYCFFWCVLYGIVLYCIVLYCVLYCIVLYCIVYCIVLYCIVLYGQNHSLYSELAGLSTTISFTAIPMRNS